MKNWEKIIDEALNEDSENDDFYDDIGFDDREQVDLLEYAESCKNQQYTDISQKSSSPINSRPVKIKRKARKKIAICITAICLSLALIVTTVMAVYMHYYGKLDYVVDDDTAYYNNYSGDDLLDASYVTNVLLIGTDERTAKFSDNARADCTMIMSINNHTNQISLISLERGMSVKYMKSEGKYSIDLLTHVFKYGGAGLLMNTVQNTFKIKVDKYMRVNFNAFEQIIDKLGGVDITLTDAEANAINVDITRTLKEGLNHLNGREALLYARIRKIDSDFKRVERQRKVLLSIKEKMKDTSYTKLFSIANDILPLVRTNISADDMAKLLFNVSSALGNDIQQATIPVKGSYQSLGNVDFEQNTEVLRQMLYTDIK